MDGTSFNLNGIQYMNSLINQLNEARRKALVNLKKRREDLLTELNAKIGAIRLIYTQEGCSAYSMSDLSFEEADYQGESVVLPPYIRLGSLVPVNTEEDIKDQLTVPFLFPYSEANATLLLLSPNNARNIHINFSLVALRLMLSLPRGMFKMWFVDNNYGRDFNVISQIDKNILNGGIITNPSELRDLLDSLIEDMISTNQKLITEDTLTEYNALEGHLPQPYTFVFISQFPASFTEDAFAKLINMIENGRAAKAGIFFFISINKDIQPAKGVDLERLKEASSVIYQNSPVDYEVQHEAFSKEWNDCFDIVLDAQFPDKIEKVLKLINGKKEEQNSLTLVPVYQERLRNADIWHGDSIDGIRIPIGFRDAKNVQYLEFGIDSDDYYGLIGGLPRMGKTNLLHNIIMWGAMEYSPLELNYYLIDCKKGTGFNGYRGLPHVSILSVSNDREFGASALDNLILEMERRAKLFKAKSDEKRVSIDKIQDYRRVTNEKMPRILAVVDEFQVLFEGNDKIARSMHDRFDKLIREGSAFGISIILCSQGIGRVDVPIANITWRLSFRLQSSAESQRILGNDGALQLTRKGQAVMNNQNGDESQNIFFQVAKFDGDIIYSLIDILRDKFRKEHAQYPIKQYISDGDHNGHIERNTALMERLESDHFEVNDRFCDIFIGEPAFIRDGHAFVRIRREQSSNILLVGSEVKSAVTIVGLMNYMLAKQSSPGSRFIIVDCFNVDNPYARKLGFIENYLDNCAVTYSPNIGEAVNNVNAELDKRIEAEAKGESVTGRVCLSIIYMQNCPALKKDGLRSSPVTNQLIRIIKEGPLYGIHVILHSSTYARLTDVIDRTLLNEFENRIVLDSNPSSKKILSEDTSSEINTQGTVLLEGPDELTTFNPDLVRVYSRFSQNELTSGEGCRFINELINL